MEFFHKMYLLRFNVSINCFTALYHYKVIKLLALVWAAKAALKHYVE